MKRVLIFLATTILIGCSNFSARKDMSSNIVFKNLKEGEHKFTLISLKYPKKYEEKVKFYKDLNIILNKINEAQKTAINLIVDEDMMTDIKSLLENGWIDKEKLAMKNASDLKNEELDYLDTLKINVPQEAGITQKILNKQYYLLLTLLNYQDMYNSNYLYTELDKNNLIENFLIERNEIINNLNKIKNNFVFTEDLKSKAIYTEKLEKNMTSPVIFIPSKEYHGLKVLKDNILIYIGENGKKLETIKYRIESNLIKLSTPLELNNPTLIKESEGVSKLLEWKRVEESDKAIENPTIEDKFINWEATN